MILVSLGKVLFVLFCCVLASLLLCTLTSYPLAACCASCLAERGDGADGWEDERSDKKALGRDQREGKVLGSTVRREKSTSRFRNCLICHQIGAEMSTSRQFSESRAIPTRTVLINDTTQLPHDYCTTPGGTLFSTTPGGNEILCLLVCFIIFCVECR